MLYSSQYTFLTLRQFELLYKYGDLQLLPEVDHLPHLEVLYPITNGGQHFRRASGSCPVIPLHISTKLSKKIYFLEKDSKSSDFLSLL